MKLVCLGVLAALVSVPVPAEQLVDRDDQGRTVRLREFLEGTAVYDVAFDPETGLPTSEVLFRDGQPAETADLVFQRGNLESRTVRDPAGEVLYTDVLYRWPNGSLRRLERDGPSGPVAQAAWAYGPSGALTSAWTSETAQPDTHRQWSYAPNRTQETLVEGTTVVLDRVTEWMEAGRSRETDAAPAQGTKTVRTNDATGRPVEESVWKKDVLLVTRTWTYDADARVLTKATDRGGIVETWSYLYHPDGTVQGSLARSGVLVREEARADGDLTEVRYYDRGLLFLVETWSGGAKQKETYYQKGQIVRERHP
jgi:hypothetical protein